MDAASAPVAHRRLDGKRVVVVGGGQTPGETIGNGRATAILFARHGARVLVVDRHQRSAEDTCTVIDGEGGEATPLTADVTVDVDCARIVETAQDRLGGIDVLHNNVGIGVGDASATRITEDAWQRILDTNLSGMWRTCRHAIPVMRAAGGGAIVNVSSIASIAAINLVAYKVSKAGVNALTQQLAIANARHGIRVNAILPGLIDTPMAVDAVAAARGVAREEVAGPRAARVPLGNHQGTAWDVAHAALYLASDEAAFVSGVLLPVDGAQSLLVG